MAAIIEVELTVHASDSVAAESGEAKGAHARPFTGLSPAAYAGLLLPIGIALLYEIAVRAGLADGRLVPAPSAVLATLWELAVKGELWVHARATQAT